MLSGGVVGTAFGSGIIGMAAGTHEETSGQRPDRVQLIEADPEYGFNYPYYLATPENYRTGAVPLMVEMNNADETISREEERRRAIGQIRGLNAQGAWLSEQLGIPHLKPVFEEPNGDPVDASHEIAQLDRTAMLHEGTTLERVDLQLLRMADHAREFPLSDELDANEDASLHDRIIMYGHSSEGNFAERMAAMHPEEILSVSASGINGPLVLPLETLGGRDLKYPVGIADLESVSGNPYDPRAHDEVNKFFIQGGSDPKNRLIMEKEKGLRRNNWDNEAIYETARNVFGPRTVEDRVPRSHIAFEKAGVSAQFRVYPEMTHDPTPASHHLLEFHRRSIEGEDVSDFGQRLRLPFDRTISLETSSPGVGDRLAFAVSGQFPPPEGLVTYTWRVDDGRSKSGPEATFTFEEPGDYDLELAMETAHGQFAQRGMSLLADGSSFGAFQYAVDPPGTDVLVDETMSIDIGVTNVGSASADRRLALLIEGEPISSREVALDPEGATSVTFDHSFDEAGAFDVRVPPAYKQTVSVRTEPPPTPSLSPELPGIETSEQPGASARTPGFGILTALAGIGSALCYYVVTGNSDGR